MKRRPFSLILAALMLLMSWGCSDKPVEPTNATAPVDGFGGYTASNEAPAFGDPTLAAVATEEIVYDDPILGTPEVERLFGDPDAGLYHFRAVWGNLSYDSTETEWTTWDGSLAISRGALVLRRVIRFEERDSVLTRTSRDSIQWVSATMPHNDGLAIDLIVPPMRPSLDSLFDTIVTPENETIITINVDTIPPAPVTLTFATGPYTHTFTMPEVASLDTIVTLDNGLAIAFNGFRIERARCPKGFLSGKWGYNDEGQGVFRGVWMTYRGDIAGFLQGHFGTTDDNKNIFYGKWIDESGRFEGLLRGHWGPMPDEHADDNGFLHAGGWFRGKVYTADGLPIGILAGRYKSDDNAESGFFMGRWRVRCFTPAENDGLDDGPSDRPGDYDDDLGGRPDKGGKP